MAVFALIHAAAVDSWYWHPLTAELQDRGQDVVAVDLPVDDDAAGLSEYAATVVEAVGTRRDVVVVGHSFGGFTAPLVAQLVSAGLLVMLQAQIPAPGEAPWPLTAWPAVRTRVLLSRGDRFLPLEFMRRVTRDRLHLEPDVMPGDHCPMLGHPTEVADRLVAYHRSLGTTAPGARTPN